MTIQLQLGLDVIRSYKRLSYTPWHAIAELVDNSTQSYFNNRSDLDAIFGSEILTVSVVYSRDNGGLLRVSDNAMGMSEDELEYALYVGARPTVTTGRSKFGMGMKTAACWLGNQWTVRTKKLGETVELSVTVDVEEVADGRNDLPIVRVPDQDPEQHYTVIEVTDHNREFRGRTLGKIKDFLRSMYREDLRNSVLRLEWQGDILQWDDSDSQFLTARDGTTYRKSLAFDVSGKAVTGWVGILDRGSRAKAGFSILHAGRVIKGWPDSWRPEEIYGQFQGSNDLINQRLIGELHLDDFDVSHTKDDILWLGNEEHDLQSQLRAECADYIAVARTRRKSREDERGPTELEVQAAVDEMRQEISSTEFMDQLQIDHVPPPPVVNEILESLRAVVGAEEPAFVEEIAGVRVAVFLEHLSPNDPYVAADVTAADRISVIVNMAHPHVAQVEGSQGLFNYLRHCVYDGVSEWRARRLNSSLDPDTIKILKDGLLRLPGVMEAHALSPE